MAVLIIEIQDRVYKVLSVMAIFYLKYKIELSFFVCKDLIISKNIRLNLQPFSVQTWSSVGV